MEVRDVVINKDLALLKIIVIEKRKLSIITNEEFFIF